MQNLNSLSTYGAHPKEFDPEQVRPVLINLNTIIKWYLKYKEVKTISKPKAEEVEDKNKAPEDSTKQIPGQNKRLILLISGIAIVAVIVVVALFVFNIIGGEKQTIELEKSIAVLPFKNDSPDQERMYFINGTMEAILDNLCKIKDLRVPGRTSVEQYRDNPKPIPTIAKELNVSYILEGSGHRDGDNVCLFVQLLDGKNDQHVWSKRYDATIEDIFFMQSEIVQLIANELKAIITPEEKQLIEKTPTINLTALDFFQRGREEHWKYQLYSDRKALEKAEDFYNKALEYDSTFAQAYTGLAWVYWNKHYLGTFFSEDFLDSVLILTDIALAYDDKLSEAYTWRGFYYSQVGKLEKAIEECDKATKYNPNDWMSYMVKGYLYLDNDKVKSIDNYQKAISLNRGEQLPGLLSSLGYNYYQSGFTEKAINCFQEAFKLDGDSLYYLRADYYNGNLSYTEYLKKRYATDTTNTEILWDLGNEYMYLRQHEEAFKYFKKWLQERDNVREIEPTLAGMHRLGYVYWQNGYKEKAEYYFDMQLENCYRVIELDRAGSYIYYDLAGVYAFRGERDKAYENLRIFNQRERIPLWMVNLIKRDPLFDSIRDEEEFQQIVRDFEAKYQAEHERVRKWLEENDLPG